jgi:carbon monoxide dehydrogenase subunit G
MRIAKIELRKTNREMRYTSSSMKLTGSYRIPAAREAVWQALLDPNMMKRILPGCEKLEPVGEHRYYATFKAGVGHIKGLFSGEISLTDLDPPNSYTLRSRMKASTGFVEGNGRIELKDGAQEFFPVAAQAATASPMPGLSEPEVAPPQTLASEELSGPATLITYNGDAKVGGLLASIAGRLIESAARKNMDEMFSNLKRELAGQRT